MERRKKGRTEEEGKRMMCGIRKERTIKRFSNTLYVPVSSPEFF